MSLLTCCLHMDRKASCVSFQHLFLIALDQVFADKVCVLLPAKLKLPLQLQTPASLPLRVTTLRQAILLKPLL